jgi:hypothetical protein
MSRSLSIYNLLPSLSGQQRSANQSPLKIYLRSIRVRVARDNATTLPPEYELDVCQELSVSLCDM